MPASAVSSPTASTRTRMADRKSTRLNSSHSQSSYAVCCVKNNHRGLNGAVDTANRTRRATEGVLELLGIRAASGATIGRDPDDSRLQVLRVARNAVRVPLP